MKFVDEWTRLKTGHVHGTFRFNGVASDWHACVQQHFRSVNVKRPAYGVYVVKSASTQEIVYIGKSGTVRQNGTFGEQDLPGRLTANEGHAPRKLEFERRVKQYGELAIEYVIIDHHSELPGYSEARLLQSYFDEYRCLPVDNKEL